MGFFSYFAHDTAGLTGSFPDCRNKPSQNDRI